MNSPWNRCDVCGRFIALDDFDPEATGMPARRTLPTPDSDRSRETWETLCPEHNTPEHRHE